MKYLFLFISFFGLLACVGQTGKISSCETETDEFLNLDTTCNTETVEHLGFNTKLGIEAVETFIRIEPRYGKLKIKEYYVSTLNSDSSVINQQVTRLKFLIKNGQYCESKFGFKHYNAVREEMFCDRHFVTSSLHLTTEITNIRTLFADIFRNILNRTVTIRVSKDDIAVCFDGSDIQISHNNTDSMFKHIDGINYAIYWKNGSCVFELAFVSKARNPDDYNSIKPYFGKNVSSQ
jgi:hypothetical protein